ncbi:MAG: hypothetical protein NT075_12615 [Chloroflexi bacterium]|nr:hypothetical protein [Chloroflexota bacterium]
MNKRLVVNYCAMLETSPELAKLIKTAQAARRPLPARLRALSLVTQTIDQMFIEPTWPMATQATLSEGAPPQDKPHLATQLPLAATDVANVFGQINHIFREQIIPSLARRQIYITPLECLTDEQRQWLQGYFTHRIYPLLTPLAVDPGHPFPYISSDSLNYLMILQAPTRPGNGSAPLYARIKVPRRAVPRIVPIPTMPQPGNKNSPRYYLAWSEDIVRHFAAQLFPGMIVRAIYQFHILRTPHAPAGEQKLDAVVRLDIEEKIPGWILHWLLEHLEVPTDVVVHCAAPLSMSSLTDLADTVIPLLASAKH